MAFEGYEKFKTPFYEVSVAAATSTEYVLLPDQVRKLIKKIEITETRENCSYNQQVIITLAEGSREPFSYLSESVPPEIYDLGENGGALTNKVGLVTDLRFVEDGVGITGVAKAAASAALDLLSSLADSGEGATGPADEATIVQAKPSGSAPQYLFQEFNKVKIRWGYLEDPETIRTIKAVIYVMQAEFPEAGQPETTITCLGSGAVLNQVAAPKAITLMTNTPTGVNPADGSMLSSFEGMTVKEAVEYICDNLGITHFVDDAVDDFDLDKGKFRVIPAGYNIDKYLTDLAHESSCHYIPMIHPVTDEFVVFFIAHTSIEKVIGEYLTYKSPGSIVKSINIKADFSAFFGAYVASVDSGGAKISAAADNGDKYLTFFDEATKANSNPAMFPVAENASSVFGNGVQTNLAEIHPSAVNKGFSDNYSLSKAKCLGNRLISMEFTTLGYTRLAPPKTVKISNIGERYSGVYNLLSVTHTLDETGYHCRCMATSYGLTGGGVSPANASTVASPPEQQSIQLINPLASASSSVVQDFDDVVFAQA